LRVHFGPLLLQLITLCKEQAKTKEADSVSRNEWQVPIKARQKGPAWFHSVGGSDSQLTTASSLASKLVSTGAHLLKNTIHKGPLTHHFH
jgi:hypothetical protein